MGSVIFFCYSMWGGGRVGTEGAEYCFYLKLPCISTFPESRWSRSCEFSVFSVCRTSAWSDGYAYRLMTDGQHVWCLRQTHRWNTTHILILLPHHFTFAWQEGFSPANDAETASWVQASAAQLWRGRMQIHQLMIATEPYDVAEWKIHYKMKVFWCAGDNGNKM
jgi:hypothetical protein